jgi:predicted transposase YbfD/YdcC
LAGQIVTTDAIGTQKDIAEQIIGKKGDYVLALKGNHPLLILPLSLNGWMPGKNGRS